MPNRFAALFIRHYSPKHTASTLPLVTEHNCTLLKNNRAVYLYCYRLGNVLEMNDAMFDVSENDQPTEY